MNQTTQDSVTPITKNRKIKTMLNGILSSIQKRKLLEPGMMTYLVISPTQEAGVGGLPEPRSLRIAWPGQHSQSPCHRKKGRKLGGWGREGKRKSKKPLEIYVTTLVMTAGISF